MSDTEKIIALERRIEQLDQLVVLQTTALISLWGLAKSADEELAAK